MDWLTVDMIVFLATASLMFLTFSVIAVSDHLLERRRARRERYIGDGGPTHLKR